MLIGSKGLILAAVRAIWLDVYVAGGTFKYGDPQNFVGLRANPTAMPANSRLIFAYLCRAPWRGTSAKDRPHGRTGIFR
jgi:hypothetical protein